jgi:hypothetical protein
MPDSSLSELSGLATRYEGKIREKLGKILTKLCTFWALAENGGQSTCSAAILAR